MKKLLLKMLVIAIAAACVTSFTATNAFASNTVGDEWQVTDPSLNNSLATITVQNISSEDNPTVTAYQIVKGKYRDSKLAGYVLCEGLGTNSIADLENPTEEEITAIASAIRNDETSLSGIEMTRGDDTGSKVNYTADVEPGLYVVLVTESTKAIVYKPAIVAVNLTDANTITDTNGGSVDMDSYFSYKSENISVNAYLKSSTVSINKSITGEDGTGEANGDAAAVGDTVYFKIDEMTIPSYSADYTEPVYRVKDNLETTAFIGINNLIVKVDGEIVDPGDDTYSLECKNKDGETVTPTTVNHQSTADGAVEFTVDFKPAFINAHGTEAVEITYSSVIANTAGYNYSENQNTASVEYSNDPINADSTQTVTDTTYHYTFGIGAKVDAESGESEYIIPEVVKVNDDSGEYEDVTNDDGDTVRKYADALGGAEFTLYTNIDFSAAHTVGTVESDQYGMVTFTGLDTGIYYLTETNAPDGYTINDTVFRIEIEAEFAEDDGVMTSYSVTTYKSDSQGERDGDAIGTVTYTNGSYIVEDDGSVTNDISYDVDDIQPFFVVDTKLAALPSTGGAGTIALTFSASIGMALFYAVHKYLKKKSKSDI